MSHDRPLFRDLLINVTNFFRDAGAFDALAETVLPRLLDGKTAGNVVRIWVADELARRSTPFAFVSGFSRDELPAGYRDRPLLNEPVGAGRLQQALAALFAVP